MVLFNFPKPKYIDIIHIPSLSWGSGVTKDNPVLQVFLTVSWGNYLLFLPFGSN